MHAEQVPNLANFLLVFALMGWGLATWLFVSFLDHKKEIKRLTKPFGRIEYCQLWNELGLDQDGSGVSVRPIRAIQKTLVKSGRRSTVLEEIGSRIKEHEVAVHKSEADITTLREAKSELTRQIAEQPYDVLLREKLSITNDEIVRLCWDVTNRRNGEKKLHFMRAMWHFALTGLELMKLESA